MMITYKPADLTLTEDIYRLEQECFKDYWSFESVKKDIENDMTIWIAALDGNSLVGYINAVCLCGEAELNRIAVKSGYRNCRIGQTLIEMMTDKLRQKNCSKVFLEVRQSNIAALSLYRHNGFETVGLRKKYYSDPSEDAIVMKLEI